MYMTGQLLKQLDICFRENYKMALLVIDEHQDAVLPAGVESGNALGALLPAASTVTAYQQRLLMFMQRMSVPVWCIRQRSNTYGPLRLELKGLYDGRQYLLRKSGHNAFRDTALHEHLQSLGITHLVVMGWNANVCVAATVGVFTPRSPLERPESSLGAIQLGYKVLTCRQILHGNAMWSHHPSRLIGFYEQL